MKRSGLRRTLAVVMALLLASAAFVALGETRYVSKGSVAINKKNFPNESFRYFVSREFDRNKDGKLSAAEISRVKTIEIGIVEGADMYNLKGIEYFTNTRRLVIEMADAKSLDIRKLTKLEYLDCWSLQIKKLDLSKNKKLKELYCDNNEYLTSLDLSKNTALVRVECYGCDKLKKLKLGNNTKLKYLNCAGCAISSLNLGKQTALEEACVLGRYLKSLTLPAGKRITVYTEEDYEGSYTGWSSGNNSVVTVSEDGEKAVFKTMAKGSTKLQFKRDGKSASMKVKVA